MAVTSNNKDLYKSGTHIWMTDPKILKAVLDLSFVRKEKFTADLACSIPNVPAELHITEAMDSLTYDWPKEGDLWLNPPYGPALKKFIEKCAKHSAENPNCRIWLLVPIRSETKYYHECIYQASTFTFIFMKKQFFSTDGNFTYKSGTEAPFKLQLSCFTHSPWREGHLFQQEFPFRGTTLIELEYDGES